MSESKGLKGDDVSKVTDNHTELKDDKKTEEKILKTKERKIGVTDKPPDIPQSRIRTENLDVPVEKETPNERSVVEDENRSRPESFGNVMKLVVKSVILQQEYDRLIQDLSSSTEDALFARISGTARPLIAFIIVPSLGLVLSDIVSFSGHTDFWSYIVLLLTCLVSLSLYFSYLGPLSKLLFSQDHLVEIITRRNALWKEHSRRYFQKRGDENAITEIENIKKLSILQFPF